MSSQHTELCGEVDEALADILEGVTSQTDGRIARLIEHVAECDRCRDKRYEAERAVEVVEAAGADFRAADDFAERMIAAVLAARPGAPTGAILPPLVRRSGEVSKVLDAPVSGPQSAPVESGARAIDGTAPTLLAPSSLEGRPLEGRGGDVDVNRTTIDALPLGDAGLPVADEASPMTGPNKTIILGDRNRGASNLAALEPTLESAGNSADSKDAADRPVVEAVTGKNNTGNPESAAASPQTSSDNTSASEPKAIEVVRPKRGSGTIESSPIDAPAAGQADARVERKLALVANNSDKSQALKPSKSSGNVISLFKKPVFLGALGTGMAAAAVAGFFLLGGNKTTVPTPPPQTAFVDGAWTGSIDNIARASSDGQSGVEVCTGDKHDKCASVAKGGAIEAGATIRTDARTRVRVSLIDGTTLSLDRNSEVSLAGGQTREATISRGVVVADVAKADQATPAKFIVPQGQVKMVDGKTDAKLSITATDKRTSVEVARASVKVTNDNTTWASVRSGEEVSLAGTGTPVISARHTMSDMLEWSDRRAEDVDGTLRGVGELRAKKPGDTQEKDHAVRLSKHQVKVRVVDVVARTEVDETFTNDSNDQLEGIYRFPLPPDAQIENLSLEVDGKLVDGAFVDRDKGAAIWRGAIHQAAPQAPKPREEIVWVPGPWHDPALLEWQRGGRFELHIFPIPAHGSRRVVITYTQTVQQSGGVRKFSYPLGLDSTAANKIDEFGIDLQVLGLDKDYGLSTRGYQLTSAQATGDGTRLTMSEKNFIPAGDLNVEYALPERDKEVTSWAYQAPVAAVTTPPATTPTTTGNPVVDREKVAKANADAIVNDTSPYVAISVRPKLPRWGEGHERMHVIVVDSSRSMVGERFSRATRLAASLVREMDRRDSFMVMACDTTCQVMGATSTNSVGQVLEPSADAAQQVEQFLGAIEPDGGSDLFLAVQAARTAAGNPHGKELRILYLGDGTPTVGPTRSATIEASMKQALPAGDGSLIAVALGNDADTDTLASMARGGGGVMIPYVPGQRVSAAALDILSAAYGSTLSDVAVDLPPGLTQVTPVAMDSIPAGGETYIYARMSSPSVKGTIKLRGRVHGDSFEQSYPLEVNATTDAGNAFIPRLYASSKIDDLERGGRVEDKPSIVALSQKFAVASRFTSLLVLESEAMFKAFGIDRTGGKAAGFDGETGAVSTKGGTERQTVAGADKKDANTASPDPEDSLDYKGKEDDRTAARAEEKVPDDAGFATPPSQNGMGGSAGPAPVAAATGAPIAPPAMPSRPPAKADSGDVATTTDEPSPRSPSAHAKPSTGRIATSPPPPRMVPMRRVWDFHAQLLPTNIVAPTLASSLNDAQAALKTNEDSRDKTVAVYKLLVASSQIGDASELASRWSHRDALDPDALVARADAAMMNGDRGRALRILSGLADVRPGDRAMQEKLITTFASYDSNLACQFRLSLADLDPSNVNAVANAASCMQSLGFQNVSNALVSSVDGTLHDRVEAAIKNVKFTPKPVFGDVRVEVKWSGSAPLDVAAIDGKGNRISLLGSPLKITSMACSVTSTSGQNTQACALAGMGSGNYTFEITRAVPSNDPISGSFTMTGRDGQSRTATFTLTGSRLEIGAAQVSYTERLVPM